MKKEQIIELGRYLTDSIIDQRIIPSELFKKLSSLIPGESRDINKLFLDIWNKQNDTGYLNVNEPLLFSRGFNSDSTTEEQLASYLPEEKILINKDVFRSILDKIDLINIDNTSQKKIIDQLNRESIGLTNSDILLYYNLLKINQLSGDSSISSANSENRDFPQEIYKLTVKSLNLSPLNVKKVNGGRVIEEKEIISLLSDAVKRKRINPQVLTICLGHKSKRFIDSFTNFMIFIINQRGDDPQEILTYIGFYILFNGAPSSKMVPLNLSSNVEAFVNDRIGRVKSVYYVAMLFLHTFNVILTAQIYEISVKYQKSSLDQKLKLEKLYSSESRRLLLTKNALNIATRKISKFKNESLEVLSAYKRFTSNRNTIVTVKELFINDWRN